MSNFMKIFLMVVIIIGLFIYNNYNIKKDVFIYGKVTQFCNGVEVPLQNALIKIYGISIAIDETNINGDYKIDVINKSAYEYITGFYITASDMNQFGVKEIKSNKIDFRILDCFVGE